MASLASLLAMVMYVFRNTQLYSGYSEIAACHFYAQLLHFFPRWNSPCHHPQHWLSSAGQLDYTSAGLLIIYYTHY